MFFIFQHDSPLLLLSIHRFSYFNENKSLQPIIKKKINLLRDFFFQAHGTFVCGRNGGGVAEEFNCERDVDICVGTLSKAAGCHGGFIACR